MNLNEESKCKKKDLKWLISTWVNFLNSWLGSWDQDYPIKKIHEAQFSTTQSWMMKLKKILKFFKKKTLKNSNKKKRITFEIKKNEGHLKILDRSTL
jgi:hypothetical protein